MEDDRIISQAVTKSLAIIRGDTLIYSRLDSRQVIIWSRRGRGEMSQERFTERRDESRRVVCDLLGKTISGDRRSSRVRAEQREAFAELERQTGGFFAEELKRIEDAERKTEAEDTPS
jgi:hypothetical protein